MQLMYCYYIDLKNDEMVCEAVLKVFNLVKQNFDILPDEPVYTWTNIVFCDQDDMLLGIMLALLRIYLNLSRKDSRK